MFEVSGLHLQAAFVFLAEEANYVITQLQKRPMTVGIRVWGIL